MNISALGREYNEIIRSKFEDEDLQTCGVEDYQFSRDFKFIVGILKYVMKEVDFRGNITKEESKFYKKTIEPIINYNRKPELEESEISKESKLFIFILIKNGRENFVFKKILKEKNKKKQERKIECIEEYIKEHFLNSLNDIYIKLKKEKDCYLIKELDMSQAEKKYFVHNNVIEEFIDENIYRIKKYEEKNLINDLNRLININGIEYIPEMDVNYNYKMTMTIYFRICNFLEYKRKNLINKLFNELTIEGKLRVEDKLLKIILKETEL